MADRAKQALVKLVLEPEWEAKFAPNTYGFRPARSCHDAIAAMHGAIKKKNAYVLDADLKSCFDNIDHAALLQKINTFPNLRRVIKGWLRGVMEREIFYKTKAGTPQGGVISSAGKHCALWTRIRTQGRSHKHKGPSTICKTEMESPSQLGKSQANYRDSILR